MYCFQMFYCNTQNFVLHRRKIGLYLTKHQLLQKVRCVDALKTVFCLNTYMYQSMEHFCAKHDMCSMYFRFLHGTTHETNSQKQHNLSVLTFEGNFTINQSRCFFAP